MNTNNEHSITLSDFLTHSDANVFIFPSIEQIGQVKKDQIIITLLRIEDLKKRISKSPNNCILKLALQIAKNRLKSHRKQYDKIINLLNE